jgi:uncharacterized membrane protein YesL
LSQETRARRAEWVDRITTFVLVNMLWAVFAALLITLPAATAGLFATLTPWVHGEPSEPFKDFFGGMRKYWRKSTMIGVIDAGIAGLVMLDLSILDRMNVDTLPGLFSRNVAIFVAALALLTNLYLWPLLVTVDLPLRKLIGIAMRFVFLHPVWSLLAGMLMLIPLLLTLVLPGFVALLLAFSSCALLASWGAWHVIEQYQRDLSDVGQTSK